MSQHVLNLLSKSELNVEHNNNNVLFGNYGEAHLPSSYLINISPNIGICYDFCHFDFGILHYKSEKETNV